MAVECRERCGVGGWESEADMAIWADQDDTVGQEASALAPDIRVALSGLTAPDRSQPEFIRSVVPAAAALAPC